MQLNKWLLGILASLIVAAILSGMTAISSHGSRLATAEAKVDSLKESQQRVETKQDKMDSKIDRIIEMITVTNRNGGHR